MDKTIIKKSLGDWFIENDKKQLLDRWDFELNKISPFDISITDKTKYYFKCPRNLHESQLFHVNKFHLGNAKNLECKLCKSFAQGIIDMYDEDYLYKIWTDNTTSPWDVGFQSRRKFVFNCDNGFDHTYTTSCSSKSQGNKCGICSNRVKNKINSLGSTHSIVFDLWSQNNELTPYDYSHHSATEVWWKCQNGIHEDYKRKISTSTNLDFRCPICSVENLCGNYKDLTGMTFGEWTVLSFDDEKFEKDKTYYWKCRCSCGNIKSIFSASLISGTSLRCNNGVHKKGDSNGNWKGGITPELISARNNSDYYTWRDSVYSKDWYTCQCCGNTNDALNAHHIRGFSKYIDLRYDVNNGISLCEKCHHINFKGSFHDVYSTRNNTPEQLEEYINNKRKEIGIDIPFTIKDYLNGSILKPIKAG